MKKKTVLIPWSGGLDSTYMIYDYLCKGYKVKAFYVDYAAGSLRTLNELKAIESLRYKFDKIGNYNFVYYEKSILDLKYQGNLILAQVPIWIFSILNRIDEDVDEVAIGYVMNDDAISFLPEIKNIYNANLKICYNKPKLVFPLIKTKKEDIWFKLPQEMKDIVVSCEEPTSDFKDCKQCPSCKRKYQTYFRDEIKLDMSDTKVISEDITVREETNV